LDQFGCRGDEHVLHAVGGSIAVAQHADAEVMQPVGIAVVYLGEGRPVARSRGARQRPVVEIAHRYPGTGHRSTPIARGTRVAVHIIGVACTSRSEFDGVTVTRV
jgi:hypothetical protein